MKAIQFYTLQKSKGINPKPTPSQEADLQDESKVVLLAVAVLLSDFNSQYLKYLQW
jgi:metal-dependent HD superfamily phosphatase/phosphodiesterase